jgi:predicted flap endonuclease-1-like 5' DNA nuclease
MTRIDEVEGIGVVYAGRLCDAGIATVEELLEKGASRAGREALSVVTGVDASHILDWVNRADLMRIHGVGSEYSDLLEAAGVDSVPELARRNSENLLEAIQATIDEKGLVRRPPSLNEIESWIDQAQTLGRTVTH